MKRLLCLICAVCIFWNLALPCEAAVPEVPVSAKAYIVMDAASRSVIYEGNSRMQLPMASTTKIMSALLCLESGDLDREFVVNSEAIMAEGSSMGLLPGDIVTKRALCYGMLLPSGNDAAGAAAAEIAGSYGAFADMMNARAAEIGMEDTHFVTPSGLHDDQHYSTAYDMALLTAEALRNPEFCEICAQSEAKVRFGAPPYDRWLYNTNKLLNMYDDVIGVKTGFTDEAGRCLVSACSRNGITLICITLNDKNDWNDHINLYEAAFACTDVKEAYLPDTVQLPVAGGEKDTVRLYAEKSVLYGVPEDSETEVTWVVEAAPFLYAPVQMGDAAGYLVHYCNGFEVARQPLYICEDIPYAECEDGFWQKIKNFMAGFA